MYANCYGVLSLLMNYICTPASQKRNPIVQYQAHSSAIHQPCTIGTELRMVGAVNEEVFERLCAGEDFLRFLWLH